MAKKPILKKLKVHALRGAMKPVEIEFHKPLTLIYGENGTGKSTLCDALDLLGNQKVGSVEGRGLGVTNVYWPSLTKTKGDIVVELEAKSNSWRATVSAKNVNIDPPADVPSVHVLRRAQILDLIQANPADRFKVIKPFIDITEIEHSESELRSLLKTLEADQTQASTRLDENRAIIERYWTRLANNTGDLFAWARQETQKNPSEFDEEISYLKQLEQSLNNVKRELESYLNAQDNLKVTQNEDKQEQQKVDEISNQALPGTKEVLEILQAANKHFKSHPTVEKCPLCESTEFVDGLPDLVSFKINQLSTLENAIRNKKQVQVKLQGAQNQKELEGNKLTTRIAELSKNIDEGSGFTSLQEDQIEDSLTILKQQIAQSIELISAEVLNEAIGSIIVATNKRREEIANYKGEINGLKSALQQYDNNIESQQASSKILPKLRQSLQIHESQRKQFVDDILSHIANEVGRLYELLHPGEGLNKIALMLNPKKKASLEIEANFYTLQSAPPAAYFSDSHLDTLGLCVSIALAAMDDLENTILVLDDVLGSIDEPHVERLVEMLYSETERFMHCIITTHYRPWREKFRLGQLRNGQCQLIELGKWSHAHGVAIGTKGAPPVDELRALIHSNPPSLQLLCASAGVLLEQLCDFITEKYECSMPRKKYGHTLGDLLPAIKDKLRTALRVEIKQDDGNYLNFPLDQKITELQKISTTRNIFGCHYNELAQHLPEQDAKRFAELVLEVAEAIICPDEGFPSSDKSGSYWSTKSESRRLHPLRKPS
jgi:energy-coupling factor transporter ATP-binding protein EcfA2